MQKEKEVKTVAGNFTKRRYLKLKLIYETAVETGKDQFFFESGILLTAFAKYLVEYLSTQFKD